RTCNSGSIQMDAVNANRPRDVLQGLLAHIFESKIEPVANMVADWSGDRYPARRSDALQARCDVDPVAKNILSLHNDVAHVHSHAPAVTDDVGGKNSSQAALHVGRK